MLYAYTFIAPIKYILRRNDSLMTHYREYDVYGRHCNLFFFFVFINTIPDNSYNFCPTYWFKPSGKNVSGFYIIRGILNLYNSHRER